MMFKGRTQRASCFCRDPDGPNFWKVHFATWGRSQYHQRFLQSVVELNSCYDLAVNNHIAHLGKDSVERIVSHIDRLLHLCQNVPAETLNVFFCCIYSSVLYQNSRRNLCRPSELLELVSEEHVCEVDLADDVGEVEELAGKELEEVGAAFRLLLVEVPEG